MGLCSVGQEMCQVKSWIVRKEAKKKDFRTEGAANRKYVDRLMVSEFGETEHAMTKMYSREQELERKLQAKFEGKKCIAFQDSKMKNNTGKK